jgi:nucleotide-binding universal stress UspA family protein
MTSPIVIGLALREDDAAPLSLGAAMAALTGTPLALVTAFVYDLMSPPPVHLDMPLFREVFPSLGARIESLRNDHEVTMHVGRGSPARVLHEKAEELEAAAVVVGSSHRGGLGRVLAGSTTSRLLNGATSAVAVAPRGYDDGHGFERIAVAYDGSAESREALDAAAALVLLSGGRATIQSYTVLEPFTWVAGIAGMGASAPVDFEPLRRSRAEEIAAEVDAIVPEGISVESEVVEGDAADVLAGVSEGVDLLVCGSRGYGPMRSVVVGGVAHALVNRAACPVLVLPRQPSPGRRLGHRRAADA